MELIIVRHGECLGQTEPAYYYDPDSPLTDLGKRQSWLTGQRLREVGITDIVSSPLQRALATAEIISEAVGKLPLRVWPELSELQDESYQGLSPEAITRLFSRAVIEGEVPAAGWTYGGLTYPGVFERCRQVAAALKAQHPAEACVLMVAHGGFINYLLHVLLNIPPTQPVWFEIANCGISRVHFSPHPELDRPNWPLYPPVQAEILSVNDCAHLSAIHLS